MNYGHPITRYPFVPEILKQAVDFTTIYDKNDDPIIRLTLSPNNSELVNPKCLEIIRERMQIRYGKYQLVSKNFENELPRNTIAVSFAEQNFKVGNSCQEFSLIDKFKSPKSSHFYYQKLSENFQVTYYNEDGVEFVAGYCYYPAPINKPTYLENDKALMTLSYLSAIEYPLADREKAFRTVEHKSYGRFCKTAEKRVTVDCSGRTGKVCHKEFDHVSLQWKYTPCKECTLDYYSYKWENPEKTPPANPPSSPTSSTSFKTTQSKPINSPTSSFSVKTTPESTPPTKSPKSLSPTASTKGLLKDYEKIENANEHGNDFDVEMVN